ncbi:MAG: hypothetical protein ACI9LY_000112 [Arenicella sp.]|jgi:hypothetical protein
MMWKFFNNHVARINIPQRMLRAYTLALLTTILIVTLMPVAPASAEASDQTVNEISQYFPLASYSIFPCW